jgi:glycosyltransferase involved in cell wall biosynthesis
MERDATQAMSGDPTLIVSYSGVLGGAERILLDCATRLDTPPVVACPKGALADAVRAAGLEHAPLPERPLRLGAAHARGLLALASDVRKLSALADTIVAWGARAVLAIAPLRRRPPLLAVHMDLLPRRGVGAAVRWATRRADGVAAASRAIAAAVGAPHATILEPGVDLHRFTPAPPPAGPPRALVLAALVPWKRPDLALEVAARVPGLELELAGAAIESDAFVRALETRAARPDLAGRVAFLGRLDDPREALARAHCLLHCADAEPWGLALVEALAGGRPVIAADAGGPREIVADGAGRLFPPGDAAAAAAALEAVLRDPAAPAAARARAERFPVEASAARFAGALAAMPREPGATR